MNNLNFGDWVEFKWNCILARLTKSKNNKTYRSWEPYKTHRYFNHQNDIIKGIIIAKTCIHNGFVDYDSDGMGFFTYDETLKVYKVAIKRGGIVYVLREDVEPVFQGIIVNYQRD